MFLDELLRHLRGPVIAVWDNASIHKGEPIRAMCRRHSRLHLELFPSYAPELNPDEGVWKLAKEELANGRPDSIEDLAVPLLSALERIAGSQTLLRSCIHHSELQRGARVEYAAVPNLNAATRDGLAHHSCRARNTPGFFLNRR